jgi:O-antigen/teichoic acid export membrane protein
VTISPRGLDRGFLERVLAPGSFARSVLTLMTGTTLANLIPVAVAPILTRLYSPAEFGLFALYGGLAALIAVPSTGRYEMAIVLPAEDEDAIQLIGLAFLIASVVFAATSLAVLLFRAPLLGALRAPALAPWLVILPLSILSTAAIQTLGSWLNRKRAYPRIAQSRIAQAVCGAALAIGLARGRWGPGGLILSALAAQCVAAGILAFGSRGLLAGAGRMTSSGMKEQAARYRNFPRVNVLHAVFDTVSVSAAVIVLSHFFDSRVVGHYSMVMRVLTAPVALIGAAITQVFYQRAAETHNRGLPLRPMIGRLLRRSSWIALPATLILLVGAPTLFSTVFGPEWATAGRYARLLAPYMFFYFLASPLAFVPFVLNQQIPAFFLSATGNLLFLGCIALGGWLRSPETGFTVLSIVQAIYFTVYIGWMLRISRAPSR